jgi:hypothetical protein
MGKSSNSLCYSASLSKQTTTPKVLRVFTGVRCSLYVYIDLIEAINLIIQIVFLWVLSMGKGFGGTILAHQVLKHPG